VKTAALVGDSVASGVILLRPSEVEVALERVARSRLADVDWPPRLRKVHEPDPEEGAPLPAPRIAIATPATGELRCEGLLVFDSVAALVELLVASWIPRGGGEIDAIIARVQRGADPQSARIALHAMFEERPEGTPQNPWRRRPRWDPFPAIRRDALQYEGFERVLRRPLAYLRRPQSGGSVSLSVETSPQRRAFCLLEGDLVVGWDGRTLRHAVTSRAPSIALLERMVGAEIVRSIGERGRARIADTERLLPRQDLRPVALLRVPSRKQARGVADRGVPPDRPPFDRCLFVRDARGAFSGLDRLPREDDPAVAASVLERVEHDVYVPGDLGSADWLENWTEDEPYEAVLCEVAAC